MRWFLFFFVFLMMGCATAPAEVNYKYHYSIYLIQSDGSKIGNIELLLETHKDTDAQLDADATSSTDVSPQFTIPLH